MLKIIAAFVGNCPSSAQSQYVLVLLVQWDPNQLSHILLATFLPQPCFDESNFPIISPLDERPFWSRCWCLRRERTHCKRSPQSRCSTTYFKLFYTKWNKTVVHSDVEICCKFSVPLPTNVMYTNFEGYGGFAAAQVERPQVGNIDVLTDAQFCTHLLCRQTSRCVFFIWVCLFNT